MSPAEPKPEPPADGAAPGEEAARSGEGAATALQALIRKRKQVEGHEDAPAPEARHPQP